MQQIFVTVCSLLALLGFVAWLYHDFSFEPGIGIVVTIGILAGSNWPKGKPSPQKTLDVIWEDLSPLLTEMKKDMENPKFKLHRFFGCSILVRFLIMKGRISHITLINTTHLKTKLVY